MLCTALTYALQELRHLYLKHEEDTQENEDVPYELEQAQGLKAYLDLKGILSWADNDFNAANAASRLYKARLPSETD